MAHRYGFHARLLCGAAMLSLAAFSNSHAEETARYNIPPQSLDTALREFGFQSGHTILVDGALTGAKTSKGLTSASDPETALRKLLAGTGLSYTRKGEVFAIIAAQGEPMRRAPVIPVAAAAETVSGSAVEGLVVTAQKRREAIQDVPIAISAFSADALRAQKIEGGFDLLKAIPNVTFSKNNFSGYNFTIRGIGTKAVSVTTDPGVAVEFNNTALIRNRLFEQEYFDIERVEVLRGPQGTLHGRNATAGVINVISAKPTDEWDAEIKTELGNYDTRRASGFVNLPLVAEKLDLRAAASWTSREGYDYNEKTQNQVNGRDLYSVRMTLGFNPTERLSGNAIWEHFAEDDNRSRTGKQLCTHDAGPETLGDLGPLLELTRAAMSQGCMDGSLYDKAAFGTPNGLSIPFIWSAAQLGDNSLGQIGRICDENFTCETVPLVHGDPYGGLMQSADLRTISSIKDPIYRAKADILELNFDFDLTSTLTLTSQTAYNRDSFYSTQDYNRFTTIPSFNSTDGLLGLGDDVALPLTPGGVFCDPQIGCADSIAGFDISKAKSTQFSQELRLQSAFEGAINFSAGLNYTRYRTVEDYYVLFNVITALAEGPGFTVGNRSPDPTKCRSKAGNPNVPFRTLVTIGELGSEGCIYIDPNPLADIDGEGHNYFRSNNPYTLKSVAGFGEMYWQATEDFKVTAGLRYTDDRKIVTPVPTQVLLSSHVFLAGTVDAGYPVLPDIEQHWGEFSGRIGFDWKPELSITDETMIYAFYSRGYKGGGVNPPGIGFETRSFAERYGIEPNCEVEPFFCEPLVTTLPYPAVFDPEFVNAYEAGAKNTLFGGGLVLNVGGFFYDYKNYQISQIKSRTAVNENFDAKTWGLELESIWMPTSRLRFNLALGYQDSEIADGEQSIDLMDRLQGHDDYTIMKPWPQLPDNCVVLKSVIVEAIHQGRDEGIESAVLPAICPGTFLNNFRRTPIPDSAFPNNGLGFFDDVSGNELPNAPHWTQSIGAQYTQPLPGGWEATLRADFYHQSQSWARVYQAAIDKLHGWKNANMVITVEKPEEELRLEFYIKNLFDDNAITDTFLNSDDTALTTNVFTLDPRLVGFSITKGF